jgi:hypothetical protein
MGNRDQVFTISLYIVAFDIFSCSCIEQILHVKIFLRDRGSKGPDSISQRYGWPLVWGSLATVSIKFKQPDTHLATGIRGRSSYKFIAARYRYLWIIGSEG